MPDIYDPQIWMLVIHMVSQDLKVYRVASERNSLEHGCLDLWETRRTM